MHFKWVLHTYQEAISCSYISLNLSQEKLQGLRIKHASLQEFVTGKPGWTPSFYKLPPLPNAKTPHPTLSPVQCTHIHSKTRGLGVWGRREGEAGWQFMKPRVSKPSASQSPKVGCTRKGPYSAKDVFLPSKHLLSAFYETKNPSKNLVFTKNPYKRLLRTLLRSTYCLDAAFLLTVGSFLLTVELLYLQLTILAF